ncbi:hypothetical protein GOP47_0003736 [Adiantum capillus-veneris]|uniref:Uncharacterized protein n=1 Tax=Adiantum capillus-veneris TaxID=13818 RepID=A0A9D4V7F6_ADICA|nr:hypothetical protein GOP47_0003736 [Adiantum capillus-veneris]
MSFLRKPAHSVPRDWNVNISALLNRLGVSDVGTAALLSHATCSGCLVLVKVWSWKFITMSRYLKLNLAMLCS